MFLPLRKIVIGILTPIVGKISLEDLRPVLSKLRKVALLQEYDLGLVPRPLAIGAMSKTAVAIMVFRIFMGDGLVTLQVWTGTVR